MVEPKKRLNQTREWQDWKPKDFLPTHCTDLIRIMSKGKGTQTFCAENNLSRALFYQWVNKYPDFKLAYDVAKLKCDEYLLDLLHEYKIESGPEGTVKLNVQIYKEIKKSVREVNERREAVMSVNLTGDSKTMMTSVLSALGAGLIDLEEATAIGQLIESTHRISEASELMAKVEALELALQSGTTSNEFKEE